MVNFRTLGQEYLCESCFYWSKIFLQNLNKPNIMVKRGRGSEVLEFGHKVNLKWSINDFNDMKMVLNLYTCVLPVLLIRVL